MQIKRFEAKNMTEALRQIKRTLGSEAVILSAKDLRRENRLLGISRQIGVEVTAAVDEDYPELSSGHPSVTPPPTPSGKRGPTSPVAPRKEHRSGFLAKINQVVGRKGYANQLSPKITSAVPSELPSPDSPVSVLATPEDLPAANGPTARKNGQTPMGRYLAKSGLTIGKLDWETKGATIIALAGNAGVGKTTVIAKLAAHYRLIHKKKVGLLSLDRRRIGGLEQLQCYADSMHLTLEVPDRNQELPEALARLSKCHLVLVDTPSVDPHDAQGMAGIKSRLQTLGKVKTLLVLSAESREEDLQMTASRYQSLNPVGVVMTKTDLTQSYADMVNFLCRQALPVLFYTSGQRVPFDLTEATIEGLAARFTTHERLKSCDRHRTSDHVPPGLSPNDGETIIYLANKNSDIFHRPECKWIRLINRTNIVEFNSFAEALNNRFKPCRYCNPQHLSITGMLSQEGAAL
ncbi:MAG: Ada metal-binding domain-containing protein [Desulfobacterales bacterium]|jgi:flagellar biosynthesis protein FlhF